jgi:predicted RNA-binding protein with PIN domain
MGLLKMPYIIDGHNLIPKIPGLDLEAADDEVQLIEMLQEFCRRTQKKVDVYFDNAPPGQPRARNYGIVTARFVRAGSTADDAIRSRLARMGRSARNWTVVSSDREVQASARSARARFISSEEFAVLLMQSLAKSAPDSDQRPDASLSPQEVKDWMELFRKDKPDQT